MDLPSLLKEFLTGECGFQDWQVGVRKMGGAELHIRPDRPARTRYDITVYLSGRKLHFILDDYMLDCCLMLGGMSTPISDNILCTLFSWLDLRDPKSFEAIREAMDDYLPENRDKPHKG